MLIADYFTEDVDTSNSYLHCSASPEQGLRNNNYIYHCQIFRTYKQQHNLTRAGSITAFSLASFILIGLERTLPPITISERHQGYN